MLEQILPISFTQNLFLLALHLRQHHQSVSHHQQHNRRVYFPARTAIQISIPLLYTAIILATARIAREPDSPSFMPSLLLTRLLLATPYVLLAPAVSGRQGSSKWWTNSQAVSASSLMLKYAVAWTMPMVWALGASFDIRSPHLSSGKPSESFWSLSTPWVKLWDQGHDNYDRTTWAASARALSSGAAVAALGWDVLIGVMSLGMVWTTI